MELEGNPAIESMNTKGALDRILLPPLANGLLQAWSGSKVEASRANCLCDASQASPIGTLRHVRAIAQTGPAGRAAASPNQHVIIRFIARDGPSIWRFACLLRSHVLTVGVCTIKIHSRGLIFSEQPRRCVQLFFSVKGIYHLLGLG